MKSDGAGEGQTSAKLLFLLVQMRVGTFLKKMAPKASLRSYWSPLGSHFDHFLNTLGSLCHPRTTYGEVSESSWEVSENDDQHRSHFHGGGDPPPVIRTSWLSSGRLQSHKANALKAFLKESGCHKPLNA